MILNFFRRALGSSNERYVKSLRPFVGRINALESSIEKLTDAELCQRTFWLKGRLQEGETLDDILVDAFATVREASKRVLGMRHFDVQLLGGVALHRGVVAEMKTGEGKTLVATLPVYLNALTGKGVHVVTVNDYLAHRDAEWMGKLYQFLGLSVGSIVHGLTDNERREAYRCDITYATNNELGFDYLRDNMKMRLQDLCQRPFNYAIVDEVDSILIDEARTPLIISAESDEGQKLYETFAKIARQLVKDTDYTVDEKFNSISMKDAGITRAEKLLGIENIYTEKGIKYVHHLETAVRAEALY
ncbi:MAG: DEAD/DEAH box helicase, partial [Holosporales bacterium]|nr:DEAD/DEAH box helicase [Holosporales bacterium]